MRCEVNQLLTAVWSPIASVQEDRGPVACNRGDHVSRFAFVVLAHDGGELRSVLQNLHGVNLASVSPGANEGYRGKSDRAFSYTQSRGG